MRYKPLFVFFGFIVLLAPLSNMWADQTQLMSPEQAKQFVKKAVFYALENQDPNMDYTKYVSNDFINYVDGNTFNFDQWVKHQKDIKTLTKSMQPTFVRMVAENNNVAAVYFIHIVKKDGSELEVKDIGYFVIKNNKIVLVDELTHLMKGGEADKDIGSLK